MQPCASFASFRIAMHFIVSLHDIGPRGTIFIPCGPHDWHIEGHLKLNPDPHRDMLSWLCGIWPLWRASNIAFTSHLSDRPNLLIELALMTPLVVPSSVSELLVARPNHTPGNHSVSALFLRSPPSPSCSYHTFSPMGTTTALQVLPRSLS